MGSITVSTASRVRTGLALGTAGATIVAALLLTPRGRAPSPDDARADDGMRISARLATRALLPGDTEQHLAISITAPSPTHQVRPPLSLAIVIDRSGSMTGEPLAHAKAAAARLVTQLDPRDAFAIVTYSGSDETVAAIGLASDANKARAYDAIARIEADGGTCISCGLVRGASELARTPVVAGGVRRIMLISDGQANVGIWDREELAQLATTTAAAGASISTIGVGLDFDEVTMTRLADVGRGSYHFVEDTRHLEAMFARELGSLAETVAADARLVVTAAPGVLIQGPTGSAAQVTLPVADLRAGETRKVVLRLRVAAARTGDRPIASAQLDWRRVGDGLPRSATATARVTIVEDAAAVTASVDPSAVDAIEQAIAARALEEATSVYEAQGAAAAQEILEQRLEAVRANEHVTPAARQVIERAAADAEAGFAAPPSTGGARATKVNRKNAYDLAR